MLVLVLAVGGPVGNGAPVLAVAAVAVVPVGSGGNGTGGAGRLIRCWWLRRRSKPSCWSRRSSRNSDPDRWCWWSWCSRR